MSAPSSRMPGSSSGLTRAAPHPPPPDVPSRSRTGAGAPTEGHRVMHRFHALRRSLAVVGAISLAILVAAPAAAHEGRTVNGYEFEVGLIDEPVYVGDKSGLEFFVHKDAQPVTDLEKTIKATVTQGSATRELPLRAD